MICNVINKKVKSACPISELVDDTLNEFNIQKLQEFTNNKRSIIISTLQLLSETLEEDSEMLSNALTNNDAKRLKAIAHKMKPNFDLIGLEKLRFACEEIQNSDGINTEEKKLTQQIIESIPGILKKLETTLNEMIN
jgi:HPt (histidine-containing phosphotransfer) domain-containing protein